MSEMLGSSSEWARKLIGYYEAGYSDAEVAAELKITIKEFNKQLAENPGFNKLVQFGRTLSTAFWEGLARKNIVNKQFNTPLYNFYMKNKYGWADKVETTSSNENTNIDLDTLREKVARQTSKFVATNHPELASVAKVLSSTTNPEGDEDE